MKALVTGGTGFIGSHLVKTLVDRGNEVRCLVREASKTDSLKNLGAELVFGDITNKDSLKTVANDTEIVYHLAAIVDRKHQKSYQEHYSISVTGTENLVKACLEGSIKKFVYFSSSAAIGVRNTDKLLDESVICHPTTSYGKAKLETEKLLLNYFNSSNFPVNIIRPPVVYGHGDETGRFLSLTKFVNKRAARNQPYPFFDHGKNLTSLCYVKNLVEATILAGESNHTGEIYHIADARPYTIREMVETIAEILNVKLKTISVPKSIVWLGSLILEPFKMIGLNPPLYRQKFVEMTANFALDISKAREQLGYNPEDNFKEYVKETVEWYRESNFLD